MVRRELARPLVIGVTELPEKTHHWLRGSTLLWWAESRRPENGIRRKEPSIPVLKGAQDGVRTCAGNTGISNATFYKWRINSRDPDFVTLIVIWRNDTNSSDVNEAKSTILQPLPANLGDVPATYMSGT